MHRFIFLLVAALVFSACTKASSVTTPVVVGPSTLDSVVSDEALQAAAPLSALSAIVPQNVDAIAAIDFSRLGGHAAAAIGGNEALAALETDLKAIFGRLLGPDLTAAGYAIAWLAHEEDALGLVLRGDFGKERLKGKALKKVAGVKAFPIEELFLAKIGPHVVVGNEAALKAMVAVRKGKRRSLLKSSAFATIDKGLSLVKGPKPVALVSAGPALLKQALGGGPLGQVEIEQLSIGLGEDLSLRAAVQADQGIRTLITGMVEDGRKAAAQEAEKTRLRALEDDDLLGAVGGAVMAHSMLSAVKMLKLETRDEALIASFEAASDAGTYLAVTSVVAAIAIPSFVKYQRRAKTTEAIDQLDRIYKGAAIYYTTPHYNAAGERLPCQFPASQGVTPVQGTCCSSGGLGGPDSDGDDRCDVDRKTWDTPTWSALNFSIPEQHRFVYTFESSGVLSDAGFTVTAYADLDCDGVMSTFQRMGFGDPDASASECSLRGSAAFYVEKETE